MPWYSVNSQLDLVCSYFIWVLQKWNWSFDFFFVAFVLVSELDWHHNFLFSETVEIFLTNSCGCVVVWLFVLFLLWVILFSNKMENFWESHEQISVYFLLVFSSSSWVTWTGCLFLEHRLSASISLLSISVSLADLSATERGLWIKLLCVFFSFYLCFHQILKHIHIYTHIHVYLAL